MEQSAINKTLVFFVNGLKVEDKCPLPETTLLTYLRLTLGLRGTKLGCGEGGCGACTVMVSFMQEGEGEQQIRHISVNACLTPAVAVHGMAVTTVEGIGSTSSKLHAVQSRIANSHGSQCGFCTPGIVMSMYTLLRNNPKPDMEDINTYLQGNLCRCTGYRPILEGFKTFTESWATSMSGGGGGGCKGPVNGVCCQAGKEAEECKDSALYDISKFQPYDPTQEPIFPPELKLNYSSLMRQPGCYRSESMTWFRPVTLKELLSLKANNPEAKIVVGNTELGVEMKFKNCKYPVMIQPSQVAELNRIVVNDDGLTFGAAVTLTRLEAACQKEIERLPAHETRIFVQIVEMLRWFAGKQIRNVAAVGGNIMTGSPISDLNQIFMAAGCKLEIQKSGSPPRKISMDSKFYTGYRKNVLTQDEVLVSITIPRTSKDQYFVAYKQARRRDDDIAIVNCGFFFELDSSSKRIKEARMAFGGMAPTTVMPTKTMKLLTGAQWSAETIERASSQLLEELTLPPGVPGAMVRYRRALTVSFLFKAFLTICRESGMDNVPDNCLSATEVFHKGDIKSHQMFEIKDDPGLQPVGQLVKHKSADKQATGEAVYIDDMPRFEDELYAAFVFSTKSHAMITGLDATPALKVPGVVDFVSYSDIGDDERNEYSVAIRRDEKVFVKDEVTAVGQVIGAVLACDQATAQRAAKMVKVTYEVLPAIVTMEEAIAANSYHPFDGDSIKLGDPVGVLKACDHVLRGSMKLGGQEHFYLETQACIAVPSKEDGEMCLYCSTQNPTETQEIAAHALGVDMNKIVCKVKRMGGGFGGKETRNIFVSTVVAVAAAKLKRPVRAMLDRDEDMLSSGHRHPFLGRYTVGFDKDGVIRALDLDIYNNGGCTMDLSFSVMGRAMFHCDNSYRLENVHVRGHVCKTNLPSNTAFRGFGGPQGMLITENLVDEISIVLGLDPAEVRRRNLYRDGDRTFFSQPLTHCTLERCWAECMEQSRYNEQRRSVAEFNRSNRWKKRGISIVPVKFGIAFTLPRLNQGGALIQIYRDGSVLLTHGGTEMGQGLHTKMIQVAGQVLGIPLDKIHVSETSTDKVPNTSPSAASVSSDLYGMATYNACHVLVKRLEPVRKKSGGQTWEDLVMDAYSARISLSATGFFSIPDLDYDIKTNTGSPFSYFTYGVGCSVVEIDCLTGDHDLLRTDIVMDVGESLNPAIDVGQIEGAFVQGYGLFVLEQLVHTPEGDLLTRGPGAYKIPGFGDIPTEFNVSLLRGAPNPRAVFSSKAVGEPPLFLASSAFFAIKDAVRNARQAAGINNPNEFLLDSPATAERIRMGCEDQFTKKIEQLPEEGSFRPWGLQV